LEQGKNILLSYWLHGVEFGSERSRRVSVLEARALLGIAAILTSLSMLIWSVRRKR
jgi:hypothetical protein